jgi:polysaccharide deacetylase 2 family uncharacterized protein YibQ
MPQKRKTAPRKTKKSKPKSRYGLGLYIAIAVLLFGLIYWLSKPASPLNIKKIKEKVSETVEKVPVVKPESPKPEPEKNKDKALKTIEPEGNVERAILGSLAKLHIPEAGIKRKKTDMGVTYLIPVDPAISDLTFANMIIKGEVERLNGAFESGIEEKHRQKLTLFDAQINKRYLLELYYKHNEEEVPVNAKIMSIIIDDFGNIDGNLLKGFAKTNPAVCFAIMPNTPKAVETMQLATQTGHESIIHIPMEPINYPRENPGDKAIFIQLSAGEIVRRTEHYIKQLPDCIGVNNHMGSLATADETTMQIVMQTLRKNNLSFVDSRTTNGSVAYKIAQKNLVPAIKRDIFLDEPDLSAATMDKKLSDINNLSLAKPYVVAIMHCHTAAHLNYLNQFIARAKSNGFKLEPISRLGSYKLPEIR